MLRSLIWKQWREMRFLFLVFVAWMTLAVCYSVGYELGHRYRATVGGFSGLASLYAVCAAVFLAMRVARGEHAQGTLLFSTSLPISLRRMAAVRVLAAVATLTIPILLSASLLSIALASGVVEQALPRNVDYVRLAQRDTASLTTTLEQLWSVAAIATLGGVELLLVLCVAGGYLRTQTQIGLLGAVIALATFLAAGVLWIGDRRPYAQLCYGILLPQSLAIHWGYADARGSYTDHELAQFRWVALGTALPLLTALGWIGVTRYGALNEPVPVGPRKQLHLSTIRFWPALRVRFPGRLSALIWLELRQSVPLAMCGLLLALLMTLANVLIEPHQGHSFATSLRMDLPHSIFVVALLWAALVGSSLYSADLDQRLGSFWRSRPISPALWFWCKFFVGLLAVLLLLDGITILVSWSAPRDGMVSGMSWAYVACFPIMHAFMFSLGVFGTCWLRRPVIGGIFAILVYAVLTMVVTAFPATNSFEPVHVFNSLLSAERAGKLDFSRQAYWQTYGLLAVSIFLLALTAARLAKPLQTAFKLPAFSSSSGVST